MSETAPTKTIKNRLWDFLAQVIGMILWGWGLGGELTPVHDALTQNNSHKPTPAL